MNDDIKDMLSAIEDNCALSKEWANRIINDLENVKRNKVQDHLYQKLRALAGHLSAAELLCRETKAGPA